MPGSTLAVVFGSWLVLLVLVLWRYQRWKDGEE